MLYGLEKEVDYLFHLAQMDFLSYISFFKLNYLEVETMKKCGSL